MAAGLSDRLLSVSNHAGLIDAALPKLGKAGRAKSGSQRKFFGDSDMPKKASKLEPIQNSRLLLISDRRNVKIIGLSVDPGAPMPIPDRNAFIGHFTHFNLPRLLF